MYLLVGLGNPGPRYALTRHNIGFMVIDALANHARASFKDEHKALTARMSLPEASEPVLLVKPQTFMNLSGESVQALMAFYKVPIENILVLHDEVDLPFGKMKFQKGRGHGGHNGIRNIHTHIGADYARLRLGVGRPTNPHVEVADYVLQNFSNDEMERIPEFIGSAADAALSFVTDGFTKTQNKYNSI